jgi:hypothetical protein
MKKANIFISVLIITFFSSSELSGQNLIVDTIKSNTTWNVPSDVTHITVQCWGAGGGGGQSSGTNRAAGGGGGAYARSSFNVTPSASFSVTVGIGGAGTAGPNHGGNSIFGSNQVVAEGGKGLAQNGQVGAAGGSTLNSVGDVKYSGGNGSNISGNNGGGGGGGAGSTQNGGNGSGSTGGTGGTNHGGKGGNGAASPNVTGQDGFLYGGGGGGARTTGGNTRDGGDGANGLVIVSYYRNLTVSGTLTITTNESYHNITITSGGQLTLASGTTLNAYGNFLIESDVNGTGTFVQETGSNLSVTGTTQVQQYLFGNGAPGAPDGRMWYVSSPLTSSTSNTFNAASSSNKLWSYNEPTLAYTEITDNTTSLIPQRGYVVRMGQNGNVTFSSGSFNNGVMDVTLTNTGTIAGKRGYNLVGNPYPSFLDWDEVDTTYVSSTMWYRTFNSSNNSMVFDTYNSTSQVGTNNNGNGAVTQYIPPMQAFWVKVKTDNSSSVLTFRNSMRSHQTGHFLRTYSDNEIIRIIIDNGSYSDENILLFSSEARNNLDSWDSEKMLNTAANIPQMWMMVGNASVSINGMSRITSGMSVPLFMTIKQAGAHSISLNLDEFNNTAEIFLEDLQTNMMHDLRTGPYQFTSNNVTNSNRFILRLFRPGKPEITPQNPMIGEEDILIDPFPNPFDERLYIQVNAPVNADYNWKISDVSGKLVLNGSQHTSKGINIFEIETVSLPSGFYIFQLSTDGIIKTKKIIKR